MRALETESHARAENLGEDAAFLRDLVLDGRWDDAITLIEVLDYYTIILYAHLPFLLWFRGFSSF